MSDIEELYERAKSGDPQAQYEFGIKLLARWQSDPGAESADKLLSNSFYWLEKAEAAGNENASRIIAGLKKNLSSAPAPAPVPSPPTVSVPAIVRRDKEKIKRLGGVILTMAGIIIVLLVAVVLLFAFRSCKSSEDSEDRLSSIGKAGVNNNDSDSEDAFSEGEDTQDGQSPEFTPEPSPVSTPASTPEPTPYPWIDTLEYQPAEVWSAPVEYEMLLEGDTLNMRAGPSVVYEVISQIPNEALVRAWAEDGEWLLVEYEGKYAWASHTCLYEHDIIGYEGVDVMPEGQYESPVQYIASSAKRCEMYAGPDIGVYHKLAVIPNGETVNAVAESGSWRFVYYKGIYGWVQGEDLSKE